MDFTRPLLSGVAATIVGTIGLALAAISIAIPQPWGFFVGLVGFLASGLAGMASRPPEVVEGSPKLQGAALAIATTLGGLLVQYWPVVPVGWPQGFAMAAAALISWLTGHALPQLGSTSIPTARIDLVGGARGAANLFNRAG
jgi:hypothetical protein